MFYLWHFCLKAITTATVLLLYLAAVITCTLTCAIFLKYMIKHYIKTVFAIYTFLWSTFAIIWNFYLYLNNSALESLSHLHFTQVTYFILLLYFLNIYMMRLLVHNGVSLALFNFIKLWSILCDDSDTCWKLWTQNE